MTKLRIFLVWEKIILSPLIIRHMHFTFCILKWWKSTYKLFWMCKSTLLLIFLSIINGNSTYLRKHRVSNYMLFFSLRTKVHMTQSSEIKYTFFFPVYNKRKFIRTKVYIQESLGVNLHLFKMQGVKCTWSIVKRGNVFFFILLALMG